MSLQDLKLTKLSSKPLLAKVQFAPGFFEEAEEEFQKFLADLWIPPKFQEKFPTEYSKSGTSLIWKNASLYNALELLSRANWIEDLHIAHPKTKEWISIAGEPTFKRGFREIFSTSAPLREDIAFLLLNFWKSLDDTVLVVPFSGTGTFAWEWITASTQFSPILYNRKFAITDNEEFQSKTWDFLRKRATSEFQPKTLPIFLIENHQPVLENSQLNLSHLESVFSQSGLAFPGQCHFENKSFLDFLPTNSPLVWESKPKHILMPIHPPYGNRHKTEESTDQLYSKIGNWVMEWTEACNKENISFQGKILCPDQSSWHHFLTAIQKKKLVSRPLSFDTKHFTQGGIDVRLVVFQN